MAKRGILNDKQERFCRQYVIDLNGTQAAIRAGYSKKTAHEQAAQLLAKLSIQNRVNELQSKIADKLEITAERIAEEYAKIGFSDFGDFIDTGNKLKDVSTLGKDRTRVIESVKRTVTEFKDGQTTTVQIKLHSKIAALDALSKHLGFYERDNRQKGVKIRVGFADE